jgi:hypothetical protein
VSEAPYRHHVSSTRVPVLVRMDRARQRGDVVQDLAAAGLEIGRVMARLGVVSGRVAPDAVAALEAVPGVSAVEREQTVRAS